MGSALLFNAYVKRNGCPESQLQGHLQTWVLWVSLTLTWEPGAETTYVTGIVLAAVVGADSRTHSCQPVAELEVTGGHSARRLNLRVVSDTG